MEKVIFEFLGGLSASTLIGVFLFAILNRFVPEKFIEKTNILKMDKKASRRSWLLIMGSGSLLFGMLVVDLYSTGLKPFYNDYALKYKLENRVEKLTADESNVLRPFIEEKTLSQWIHIRNKTGAVDTLVRDGVIWLVQEKKETGYWHYNIERWAYFYLLDHPEALRKND